MEVFSTWTSVQPVSFSNGGLLLLELSSIEIMKKMQGLLKCFFTVRIPLVLEPFYQVLRVVSSAMFVLFSVETK
jgi:hypothetical protein